MRLLAIQSLNIRHLRNLQSVDVEPSNRFNVISGDNGSGKTSLLEAIYLVATSRSFRASRPGDVVEHGTAIASVRAMVREDGEAREQTIGLKSGARTVRVDGKKPATLASYAVQMPAVVFHPGVLSLSMGPGAERRKLLDRLALYSAPTAFEASEKYTRALRARQRVLETRGALARDLDEYEQLIVQHGLELLKARQESTVALKEAATLAFGKIGAPGSAFSMDYHATAPSSRDEYLAQLAAFRPRDLHRGSASIGPHRDDLTLLLNGSVMRTTASQGQHRAVVLALKLAEIEVVARARQTRPILLLDEVSSELDRHRSEALFTFLREERGQVFLTTTRPELIEIGLPKSSELRQDFAVSGGLVRISQ